MSLAFIISILLLLLLCPRLVHFVGLSIEKMEREEKKQRKVGLTSSSSFQKVIFTNPILFVIEKIAFCTVRQRRESTNLYFDK